MPNHIRNISPVERAFHLISCDKYVITKDGIFSNKTKKYLKQYVMPNGYVSTCLTDNHGSFTVLVHQLVALNKYGLYTKLEVNHIDGNKLNNDPENIELTTTRENIKHSIRLGLKKPIGGSDWWISKLTKENIKEIFNMRRRGLKQKEISSYFNINQSNVSRILNGKRYVRESEVIRQ